MSIDLGRRLIAAGLVPPEEVEAALFVSVARGVPFTRLLIDRGAITERGLEQELERLGGLGLRQVAGAAELVARLPRAMCRRLAALPTKLDPHSGTVDVAAADPLDPHIASEFGFHLGMPIRVVRAPIAAVEEAIRRLELDEPEEAVDRPRERRKTPPFPHGAPQSSIPPPVLDEAPIPLVRRTSRVGEAAPVAPEPGRTARATEPAPGMPDEAARPKPVAVPAPFTMGARGDGPVSPHRATIRPDSSPTPDRPRTSPTPAPASPLAVAPLPRRRSGEQPAVSFPSVPPGSASERHTPPYGTPALAPPAAPIELGRRGHGADEADTEREPQVADDREAELPPAPKVARPIDAAPVLAALERAATRDEVIRHAMRGMRLAARRIAVFAVKRDGFHGWSCNVDFGDQDAFRAVVVPSGQPSVLATAAATAIYLGPVPATPAHEALLAVMETASGDVAAVAARVAGKPALVLLADELDDSMLGTRFLTELGKAVGDALEGLIKGR